MAQIFLSHSNDDNHLCRAFKAWLHERGYGRGDVFIDFDDIVIGTRWRDSLETAFRRCEAVILLASPAAMTSAAVREEIELAEKLGKPVLVAILYDLAKNDARLGALADRQLVKLDQAPAQQEIAFEHNGATHAVAFNAAELEKLAASLARQGLAPDHFLWRPPAGASLNPYPGLRGFTTNDAAIFFGRDPEIGSGLGRLEAAREADDGRMIVIQAASGAGKSSFLKAGLWPRLKRDNAFEPLAILRPSGGVLRGAAGLAEAASAASAEADVDARGGVLPESPDEIAAALLGPISGAEAMYRRILEAFGARARAARFASDDDSPPTMVFGVDQAEELFLPNAEAETSRFLELMERDAAAPSAFRPVYVLTLRADSSDALISTFGRYRLPEYETMPLAPIQPVRFAEIITGPAAVATEAGFPVTIDPDLTDKLVQDSDGADALPLLSVLLEQLVDDQIEDGAAHLTMADFVAKEGLGGALSRRLRSAQKAAKKKLPDLDFERVLKRLMIRHLATWDTEQDPPEPKRAVAHEAPLATDEAMATLINELVEKRLVTRSADGDGAALLEVAHEALLRQPPISTWLFSDLNFLSWREIVKRARQMDAKTAGEDIFGAPGDQVEDWLVVRADEIDTGDRAFVEKTLDETNRRASMAKRNAARTQIGLAVAIAFSINFIGVGFAAYQENKSVREDRDAACDALRDAAPTGDAPEACAASEPSSAEDG